MGIEIKPTGDGYAFDCGGGIAIELERLAEESGGLTGEITIADNGVQGTRLLHSARLNLMSSQSRNTLVKSLEKACEGVAWYRILEEVCFLAKDAFRQGDPLIEIGHLPPSQRPRWLLFPFLEYGGPTILFGDGGTGKSFFAMAMTASLAGGFSILGTVKVPPMPVLYLDWETDEYTHDQRLKAICHAIDREPPHGIFYRRQVSSLEASAANLRREIVKREIGFVVVDSMAAARGGEPESADVTQRIFNAARSLGVPWLGIDHITKSNSTNGDAKKPFGSAFTHNRARMTWGAEGAQDEDEDYKGITLTNHKANNGRLQPKQTWRVQYHNDDNDELMGVEFARCDVTEFPKLAEREELGKRILSTLKRGCMTYEELAEQLPEDLQAIRVRMSQLRNKGLVERVPGRSPYAFGLVDNYHAN